LNRQLAEDLCVRNADPSCIWNGEGSRQCRYPNCSDLDNGVCDLLPETREYRAAAVLTDGCRVDTDTSSCVNRKNQTTDDESAPQATATCYLGIDPQLALSSAAAKLQIRIAVAEATETFLGDEESSQLRTITVTSSLHDEPSTSIAVKISGNVAAIEHLQDLFGNFSVKFDNEIEAIPEFLRGFEIRCTPTATMLPTSAIVQVSGSDVGYITSGGVTAKNDDASTCTASVFASPWIGSQADEILLNVGSHYRVNLPVMIQRPPSKTVRAVLSIIGDVVRPAAPVLSVFLHPTSVTHSSAVDDATVCIAALYEGIASTAIQSSCLAAGKACTTTVTVPPEWFPKTARIQATVVLFAGVCDASANLLTDFRSASKVATVKLGPSITGRKLPEGRMLFNLPPSVQPGTSAVVFAESSIDDMGSFRLKMNVEAAAMQMIKLRFVNGWFGSMRCNANSTTCSIFGSRLLVQTDVDDGFTSGSSAIMFELEIDVSTTVLESTPLVLGGSIESAFDGRGNSLTTIADSKLLFTDRDKDFNEEQGRLFLSPDVQLVGIIPQLEVTQFVNTAVMGGVRISSNLQVLGVFSSGRSEILEPNRLECTSSDTSVISVTSNCTTIFVDGSETRGGLEKITIAVKDTTIKLPQLVNVFFPDEESIQIVGTVPGDATNSKSTSLSLHPVHGWREDTDSNKCQQQWQRSLMKVFATFTDGEISTPSIDVSEAVSDALSIKDDSLATIVPETTTIVGKSAGETTVVLKAPLGELGSLSVQTDDTPVYIQQVLVYQFGILNVGTDAGHMLQTSPGKTTNVSLTFDSPDQYHHRRYTPFVLLTDNSFMSIDGMVGVAAKAFDENVEVFDGGFQLIGDGTGSLDVFLVDTCNSVSKNIAFGRTTSSNKHSIAAQALRVSETSIQIAHPESPAGDPELGMALKASFELFLAYDNGVQIDVSTEQSLIKIDAESGDPNDLISIKYDERGVATVAATRPHDHGFAKLKFTVPTLPSVSTAVVNVQVVGGSVLRVSAVPWPRLTVANSEQRGVTVLDLIGTSEVHQEAVLVPVLELDGELIDASKLSRISYHPVPEGIVNLTKSGNDVVVSAFPGAIEGLVNIYATLGSLESVAPVKVQTSRDPVTASEIITVSIARGTVGGTIGSFTYPVLEAFLTDGAKFTSVDGEAMAGIARYEIERDAQKVVSLDPRTGKLRILANHYKMLTMRVGPEVFTRGAQPKTTQFAANLEPAVGDVDLGESIGVALPGAAIDSDFEVLVRVNTGEEALGAMHVTITFDERGLVFVGAGAADGWEGVLRVVSHTDRGELQLGGTSVGGNRTTGVIDVLKLRFHARGVGVFPVGGAVNLLSNSDGEIIAQNKPFVAGAVAIEVGPARRGRERTRERKQDATPLVRRTIESQASSPPQVRRSESCDDERLQASGCDLNNDCICDMRDVLTLYNGIESEDGGGAVSADSAAVFKGFDMNANGMVDSNDLSYFLGFILGEHPFVRNLRISPSSERTSCILSVACDVFLFNAKESKVVPAPADGANIFFQLAGTDAPFAEQAFNTALSPGTVVELVNQSNTFHGAVWRAAPQGSSGVFGVKAETGIAALNVGLSVLASSNNYLGQARESTFLTAAPVGPFDYPELSLVVPMGRSITYSVEAQLGYSPFKVFDHPISSDACLNGATVYPVTTTITATTSSTTMTTTTVVTTTTTRQPTKPVADQEKDLFVMETIPTTTVPPTTEPPTEPPTTITLTSTPTTSMFVYEFAARSASPSTSGSIAAGVMGGIAALLIGIAIVVKMRQKEQLISIVADPEAFKTASEMLRRESISDGNGMQETNLDNEAYDEPVMFVDTPLNKEPAGAEGGNTDQMQSVAADDTEADSSEESDGSDSEANDEVELSALVALPPHVAAALSARGCTLLPDCPCTECKGVRQAQRMQGQVHERRRDRADLLVSQIQQLSGVEAGAVDALPTHQVLQDEAGSLFAGLEAFVSGESTTDATHEAVLDVDGLVSINTTDELQQSAEGGGGTVPGFQQLRSMQSMSGMDVPDAYSQVGAEDDDYGMLTSIDQMLQAPNAGPVAEPCSFLGTCAVLV
jgi:hypothetical protein